jgi:hypothetical protein
MTLLGWKPRYDLEQTIERSMAYWFDGVYQSKNGEVAA